MRRTYRLNTLRDHADVPIIAYESEGNSSALCQSNSTFLQAIGYCNSCVDLFRNVTTDTTLLTQLQTVLTYCDSINSTESNKTKIQSLLSQESALVASAEALSASLAYLGVSASDATTTQSSLSTTSDVKTSSVNPTTVYETGSAQATATSSGSQSNVSTIVPAVVLPVCVVGLAVVLGFFFLRRRRSQQSRTTPADDDHPLPPPEDKPQLHADEFRPELEATSLHIVRKADLSPVEMPVREEVARELDDRV